jgi:hypothetical protein
VEARCLAERNCNVSVASLARLVRAARQRRNTARCVAAQHGSTRPGVRSRLSRMICRPPPIDRRGPLNRRGERRVAVPGLHHVITLVPSADRSLPARAPARLGQVEAPGSRRDEAPPGRGPFQKLMKLATHRFYRQAQHRTVGELLLPPFRSSPGQSGGCRASDPPANAAITALLLDPYPPDRAHARLEEQSPPSDNPRICGIPKGGAK